MINYLIAIAVGIIEFLVSFLFCRKKKVFLFDSNVSTIGTDDELNDSESGSQKTQAYTKLQCIVLLLFTFIVYISTSVFLINNTGNIFGFIKLSIVLSAVVMAAIIDYKLHIIPNIIILVGLSIRVIIYLFEIIYCSNDILEIVKSDFIGLALGFGILLIAHLISRSSVGMGDIKLFALIGICSGGICTYTTLLFSLIINTVVSIILMIFRKKEKKDAVPFAPAICLGYIVALFVASF